MNIIVIPDQPSLNSRRFEIAKSLASNGNETHFLIWDFPYGISPSKFIKHIFTSLFTKEFKQDNVTIHKIGRLPLFWPYINGIIFKHQLRKIYKRTNAEIIFTESYTNETEVPKNLPFIYDLADDYAAPADLYGSRIYKLAFKLLNVKGTMRRQCKNALAVTVVSEILYDYALQYNKAVHRLYNGIDASLIRRVLKSGHKNKINPHSILYVTGFGPWSRAVETMETVTKLKAKFPNIDLTLIGDGTEVDNMKTYIQDNRADDYIHYLGYIRDREILFQHINNCSIGLNISQKNKWRDAAHPMKVMEYSALAKKVVSTNLAEVEKLKYKNIFIFSDSADGPTFYEALHAALSHKNSKDEYLNISEHILADFDWNTLTRNLVKLFRKVKK